MARAMPVSSGRRLARRLLGSSLLFLIYIFAAGSVSKALTSSDVEAIAQLGVDADCRSRTTFHDEVTCIRAIQTAVLTIVPDMNCAPKGANIEPMDFIKRRYGCCFDRERFIGKALEHYGYVARRAAMYERRHGYLGFLIPGIASHAATEVLTRRGWLAVDSEQPFILVTRRGQPLTFDQLHLFKPQELQEGPRPDHRFLFEHPYFVVRGLYSRHGRFHGIDLPAPEIHYSDFVKYTVLSGH